MDRAVPRPGKAGDRRPAGCPARFSLRDDGGARAAEIGGSFPGPDNIVDYKLGATYTIDGWAIGLAYIATNRDYAGYTDTGKNISDGTALLSVTKSF